MYYALIDFKNQLNWVNGHRLQKKKKKNSSDTVSQVKGTIGVKFCFVC